MTTLRLFGLAGVLACALHAGTVVFDNTGELNIDPSDGGSDPVAAEGPLYDSFTTADVSGLLTGLQLGLTCGGTGCPIGGSFQVELYMDLDANPADGPAATGESLLTVNDSSLSGGTTPTIYTYTVTVPVTLAADATYWIGLSGTTTGVQWVWPSANGWNDDPSGTPGGVGVAGNYNLNTAIGTPSLDGPNSTPYLMSVTESVASSPEPSTSLLLGGGAGILVLLRRFAKRRTSSHL
jgi:hypothetical protein